VSAVGQVGRLPHQSVGAPGDDVRLADRHVEPAPRASVDLLSRRLPDLLAPGGYALLCLNAPELDSAFLRQQVQEQAPTLQFVERLANPTAFADAQPERALKVLVYREAG